MHKRRVYNGIKREKEPTAGLFYTDELFHTVWKHSRSWGPVPDEHLQTEPRSCWVLRVGPWRYRCPCLWWSWTLCDTLYDHYRKTYSSLAEWHPTPEMVNNTNESRKCTLKTTGRNTSGPVIFSFNRFRLTSKQMFSPSLSQSNHRTT